MTLNDKVCIVTGSARGLERFLIWKNRKGSPDALSCDSRCGLEKEASLHDPTLFE